MSLVQSRHKLRPEHLARKAIVYLRQSSSKQLRQNHESRRLQVCPRRGSGESGVP